MEGQEYKPKRRIIYKNFSLVSLFYILYFNFACKFR